MLKHYGLYLDTELDADLIAYLDAMAKSRRVGETLRAAVRLYRGGGGFVAPAPVSTPQPAPEPPRHVSYLGGEAGSTKTAKDKFKSAFGVKR